MRYNTKSYLCPKEFSMSKGMSEMLFYMATRRQPGEISLAFFFFVIVDKYLHQNEL